MNLQGSIWSARCYYVRPLRKIQELLLSLQLIFILVVDLFYLLLLFIVIFFRLLVLVVSALQEVPGILHSEILCIIFFYPKLPVFYDFELLLLYFINLSIFHSLFLETLSQFLLHLLFSLGRHLLYVSLIVVFQRVTPYNCLSEVYDGVRELHWYFCEDSFQVQHTSLQMHLSTCTENDISIRLHINLY